MRDYYHFYPTCPSCHEPHIEGSPLTRISGKNIKCSSCATHSLERIDILSSDDFKKSAKFVLDQSGEDSRKYLSNMPLLWKVSPNTVEEEYIRWLEKNDGGKFLITWPWSDVKFIPLMVTEYLLNNRKKKAVIIGNLSSGKSEEKEITSAGLIDVFYSLLCAEKDIDNAIEESLKKDMKKLNKSYVLKKHVVVNYRVHQVGSGRRWEDICDGNVRTCRGKIKNEITDTYGSGSIKSIDESNLEGQGKNRTINKNGFIKIKLFEQERWIGKLNYKPSWLWSILSNLQYVHRPKNDLKHQLVVESDKEAKPIEDARLFLLSDELDSSFLYQFISSINPQLVIIQNADTFMKDIIYHGEKSSSLLNFIEKSESLILMFSTDPDIRHLYNINDPDGRVTKYGITAHTWDSEIILENIGDRKKNESEFPNPVSSKFDEVAEGGRIPEVEYIKLESLDELDNFLDNISSIIDDTGIKRDIRRYIFDMKKSPLIIKGDYERSEIFKRKGRFLDMLTYDYIMSILRDEIETDEEFNKLKEPLDKVFNVESETITNPVLDKIIEKTYELLEKDNINVTIVVHGYDVKGTEKLLSERGLDEFMQDRLTVCSWKKLLFRETELGEKGKHYVISTRPPSLEYSLYFADVSKFIFISGKEDAEKIEMIIQNRLTETRSKPVHLLSEGETAPPLLKKLLEKIELPSNEVIKQISEEMIIEFDETSIRRDDDSMRTSYYAPNINPGERAFLVVDTNKKGMFIPRGSFLFIKDDHTPSEIFLDHGSSAKIIKEKLENKDILVDKHGVYISFRTIFIRFMMLHGEKVTFKNGPYKWHGFRELYEDSLEWIRILEEGNRKYSKENGLESEDGIREFAKYLSSLNLTAKNPDYIKGWWTEYEHVDTEYGLIRLYMVEHPRSLDDITKMYRGLNEILPDMDVDPDEAERTYVASITIQNFRRSLLKRKIAEISPTLRNLYIRLEREISQIIDNSPAFRVNLVYDVELTREVEAFRIMDNYGEFIKTGKDKS